MEHGHPINKGKPAVEKHMVIMYRQLHSHRNHLTRKQHIQQSYEQIFLQNVRSNLAMHLSDTPFTIW